MLIKTDAYIQSLSSVFNERNNLFKIKFEMLAEANNQEEAEALREWGESSSYLPKSLVCYLEIPNLDWKYRATKAEDELAKLKKKIAELSK